MTGTAEQKRRRLTLKDRLSRLGYRQACKLLGAALALILEEKMALGLAAPPQPRVPMESLPDEASLDGLAAVFAKFAGLQQGTAQAPAWRH